MRIIAADAKTEAGPIGATVSPPGTSSAFSTWFRGPGAVGGGRDNDFQDVVLTVEAVPQAHATTVAPTPVLHG